MRQFTENEIEKYLIYTNENVIDVNDEAIKGRCHTCGKLLIEVDVPAGAESKVTCSNCVEYFIERYESLEDDGELN